MPYFFSNRRVLHWCMLATIMTLWLRQWIPQSQVGSRVSHLEEDSSSSHLDDGSRSSYLDNSSWRAHLEESSRSLRWAWVIDGVKKPGYKIANWVKLTGYNEKTHPWHCVVCCCRSKVKQLQQLLSQNAAFSLRDTTKPAAMPSTATQSKSLKRPSDEVTASPASLHKSYDIFNYTIMFWLCCVEY